MVAVVNDSATSEVFLPLGSKTNMAARSTWHEERVAQS